MYPNDELDYWDIRDKKISPGQPVVKTKNEQTPETQDPMNKTKSKESRVVTIERFETFLFELHRMLRQLQFLSINTSNDYPEMTKFVKKHSK